MRRTPNFNARVALAFLYPFFLNFSVWAQQKTHTVEQIQNSIYAIYLEGSWAEMGRQYGSALSQVFDKETGRKKNLLEFQYEKIRSYVQTYHHMDLASADFFIESQFENYLQINKSILRSHHGDFLQGVSHSSGLPIWKLLAISYPFDLAAETNHMMTSNCSFLAIQKDDHIVLGRTMDWYKSMESSLNDTLITVYAPTEQNPLHQKAYEIGHIGFLGVNTGGNANGVFAELNSGHLSVADQTNMSVNPYPMTLLDVLISSSDFQEFKSHVTDWSAHQPGEAYTVGAVGWDPMIGKQNAMAVELSPVVAPDLIKNVANFFYQIRFADSKTVFENDNQAHSHPNILVSTNVFRMPHWPSRLPQENPITQKPVLAYHAMENTPSGDPNDLCQVKYGRPCCFGSDTNRCFDFPPPTKSMSFFRYNNLLALAKKIQYTADTDQMKFILDQPLGIDPEHSGATEDKNMPDYIQAYNNDSTFYEAVYDTAHPKQIWLKRPFQENTEWISIDLAALGL